MTLPPILRVERWARRLPPQLDTARHVCWEFDDMALAAIMRVDLLAPMSHLSTPPSPAEMRSSSAAGDMERRGAPPAGTATETSPSGSHSSASSLKSATLDSSPAKAT
eukprot:CAMPEP_0175267206 /NCGR_PEP_ID=MMETSP0093-20121207/43724_1 /TAXON_ID=311494 /ORGANISM="Alexandrium monilatum, Strain CCMP3105" /LENGTH=107 /DNA_ID=CAMNT_0016561825 /DNA_START=132 /DNA_END=451 /DNA_ORIENTATION=+